MWLIIDNYFRAKSSFTLTVEETFGKNCIDFAISQRNSWQIQHYSTRTSCSHLQIIPSGIQWRKIGILLKRLISEYDGTISEGNIHCRGREK